MSIIILTPKPKDPQPKPSSVQSLSSAMTSDFLHLVVLEGPRFETYEQLRDFAEAQIAEASGTVGKSG